MIERPPIPQPEQFPESRPMQYGADSPITRPINDMKPSASSGPEFVRPDRTVQAGAAVASVVEHAPTPSEAAASENTADVRVAQAGDEEPERQQPRTNGANPSENRDHDEQGRRPADTGNRDNPPPPNEPPVDGASGGFEDEDPKRDPIALKPVGSEWPSGALNPATPRDDRGDNPDRAEAEPSTHDQDVLDARDRINKIQEQLEKGITPDPAEIADREVDDAAEAVFDDFDNTELDDLADALGVTPDALTEMLKNSVEDDPYLEIAKEAAKGLFTQGTGEDVSSMPVDELDETAGKNVEEQPGDADWKDADYDKTMERQLAHPDNGEDAADGTDTDTGVSEAGDQYDDEDRPLVQRQPGEHWKHGTPPEEPQAPPPVDPGDKPSADETDRLERWKNEERPGAEGPGDQENQNGPEEDPNG